MLVCLPPPVQNCPGQKPAPLPCTRRHSGSGCGAALYCSEGHTGTLHYQLIQKHLLCLGPVKLLVVITACRAWGDHASMPQGNARARPCTYEDLGLWKSPHPPLVKGRVQGSSRVPPGHRDHHPWAAYLPHGSWSLLSGEWLYFQQWSGPPRDLQSRWQAGPWWGQ